MILWYSLIVSCALSLLGAVLTRELPAPIAIVGSWVRLEHVENPGIAFGILLPRLVLPAVLSAAFVAILLLALRSVDRLERAAYGVILGGALANIIDRLPDGYVTDVVAVRGFSVFNIADAAITIGALLIAWSWWRGRSA